MYGCICCGTTEGECLAIDGHPDVPADLAMTWATRALAAEFRAFELQQANDMLKYRLDDAARMMVNAQSRIASMRQALEQAGVEA